MERLTGQWYLKKGLFGDKIMVEKEYQGLRGDPITNFTHYIERKFVEANQTDLYEIINKNQPKNEGDILRELCYFQHWLGTNYNDLPTDSDSITLRAIKFLKEQQEKTFKLLCK